MIPLLALLLLQTPAVNASPAPILPVITPVVTDSDREALTITAAGLDLHLTLATSALATHVRLTLRNDTPTPQPRAILQLSSTLHWGTVSSPTGKLPFQTQTVETDADHTGAVSEAVINLPQPLAPGQTTQITAVYSGFIPRTSARLDRIGAPSDQARQADWDEIAPEGVFLRGFGQVLWYPVAAAPVFLGDGARLVESIAHARAQPLETSLRLAVEYIGEPPRAAYFRGRREPLTAHSDNEDVPIAEAPGIATADFGPQSLAFAIPSLFVTMLPEITPDGGLLTAVTEHDPALKPYTEAAALVQPLLAAWYGSEGPAEPLRLIDHIGQPFTERALVVAELDATNPQPLAPALAAGLSHAWMPSRISWIEEGLSAFFPLLWIERTAGRDRAIAALQQQAIPLALADAPGRESLLEARDDIYVRAKAAAVWWMLRSIVGDETLQSALHTYRLEARTTEDPYLLQRILERKAATPLSWFFDDWVYADKGLPDLSIVSITPRKLPAQGPKGVGWLVAVAVKNDGDAVAEVPITVRSGTLTATERLRIPARSTASTRILFEKTPEEVQVNDGETPELRASLHTRHIEIATR